MSEQASYYKIGLFVVAAAAILTTGLVMLGVGAFSGNEMTLETYIGESVQGLDKGSALMQRGVAIGRVSKIGFVSDTYKVKPAIRTGDGALASYILVEMKIEIGGRNRKDYQDNLERQIALGGRVRLTTTGLMGTSYLEMVFTDPKENPPLTLAWTPKNLYIPSIPSRYGQLGSAAERIARQLERAQIDKVVEHIDTFVTHLDEQVQAVNAAKLSDQAVSLLADMRSTNMRLKQILDNPNVDKTVGNVAALTGNLRQISQDRKQDIDEFLKDLPQISAKLNSTAGDIDALIKDIKQQGVATNFAEAAKAAAAAAERMDRMMMHLDRLVASRQQDFKSLISDMRSAMQNLDRLSQEAASDPSRLLFGAPPRPINPEKSGGR